MSTAATETVSLSAQVEKLKQSEVEYNDCRIRPSDHAFSILSQYEQHIADFPTPELTPDGDAGFDVEWEQDDRRVVMFCPEMPHQRATLCWRFTERYDGADASPGLLKEKLNELFVTLNQ